MTIEIRSYQLDRVNVRNDGEARQISGYAAVFERLSVPLGGFREKIAPGAFAESIGGDVRALWQHDSAQVLGRTRAGTLDLWEDDRGLGFELEPADTQAGRDALTLIARGDVDQMSFGFTVPKGGDEWEEEEDGMVVRTLVRVELVEVSPVTFPAYVETSVDVVRSAPEWVQRALCQSVTADGVNDRSIAAGQSRARLALLQRQLDLVSKGVE